MENAQKSSFVKPENAHLLTAMPGDTDAKLGYLRPILESRHRGMMVLRSRFLALVEVPELRIDSEGMEGDVGRSWIINLPGYCSDPSGILRRLSTWHISCRWEHIFIAWNEDGSPSISGPYYGWTVWPESRLVSQVEEFVKRNDLESASRLL